jgi:hypothetical protein
VDQSVVVGRPSLTKVAGPATPSSVRPTRALIASLDKLGDAVQPRCPPKSIESSGVRVTSALSAVARSANYQARSKNGTRGVLT